MLERREPVRRVKTCSLIILPELSGDTCTAGLIACREPRRRAIKDAYPEWQKAVSKILLIHQDQAFVEILSQLEQSGECLLQPCRLMRLVDR
jgi:hypothetical protein